MFHLIRASFVQVLIPSLRAGKSRAVLSVASAKPFRASGDQSYCVFKKSEMTGPVHGIPILVKDQLDVAGLQTTLGITFLGRPYAELTLIKLG